MPWCCFKCHVIACSAGPIGDGTWQGTPSWTVARFRSTYKQHNRTCKCDILLAKQQHNPPYSLHAIHSIFGEPPSQMAIARPFPKVPFDGFPVVGHERRVRLHGGRHPPFGRMEKHVVHEVCWIPVHTTPHPLDLACFATHHQVRIRKKLRVVRTSCCGAKPITDQKVWKDNTLVLHLVLSLPAIVYDFLSRNGPANCEHRPVNKSKAMSLGITTLPQRTCKYRQMLLPNHKPNRRRIVLDNVV